MIKSVVSRAAAAAVFTSLALCGTIAHAQQAPNFRALTFAGVNYNRLPDGQYVLEEMGGTYFDSPTPANASMNYSHTYTGGPQGDTQFLANSAANYRGFWSAGTHAQAAITNAYPSTAEEAPQGFYVLGGIGSHTKHRFVSPESVTGPFSVFNWHVSGNSSTNLGVAQSRLDFAVTTGASGFGDLYNAAVTPNLMTKFGPGSYSYNTAVAMDTPLDFLFWSSAFVEVKRSDLEGMSATDIFGTADFMSTFELDSIELYNQDGTRIETWSLIDETTGEAVFTEKGRVGNPTSAIPEPGTALLLVGGLLPLAGIRMRRRRA